RSSAEWIEESTGRLADFNTVTFTNASATANLITGPISDPAWQTEEITLVSKSGGVLAAPTPLFLSDDTKTSSVSIREANSNKVAKVSHNTHAAIMALLSGDAGQHFSQLGDGALLPGDAGQHFSQLGDGAHAANMALLSGDAGQHFSQLGGDADVHHDWDWHLV